MSEIEKLLVEADFIIADDNYISDGFILIRKDSIESKALKNCKTVDNIFKEADIPYGKGTEFEPMEDGTKCEISDFKVNIRYNNEYSFDFDYVQLLYDATPIGVIPDFTVVLSKKEKNPILKVFDDDGQFIGCLAGKKRMR